MGTGFVVMMLSSIAYRNMIHKFILMTAILSLFYVRKHPQGKIFSYRLK